jgi:hypothetical protein
MIDPFVLLTPVFLVGVFALVRFVGCLLKPEPPLAPTLAFDAVGTPNADTGRTNQFSTTDKLLLAFVAADQNAVTGISAPGLSFALVVREIGGGGTAEIWQAAPTNPLNNVVVTASVSTPGVSTFVYVVGFSVGDGSSAAVPVLGNTGHQSGSDGKPIATLMTMGDNSLIFGVGIDFDNAITPQEGSNQTIVQPAVSPNPPGDTYWVQRRTDMNIPSSTQVQIDDTLTAGDHWNLCICEIRVS